MKKTKLAIAATCIGGMITLTAGAAPAYASHRCALEPQSVNNICEGYHDPKGELQYIVCLATLECPL